MVCYSSIHKCRIFIMLLDEYPLLAYQVDCVEFVGRLLDNPDYMGAIIADEMGLGKTGMLVFYVDQMFGLIIVFPL